MGESVISVTCIYVCDRHKYGSEIYLEKIVKCKQLCSQINQNSKVKQVNQVKQVKQVNQNMQNKSKTNNPTL